MRRTSRRALAIITVAVVAPDGLAQTFIGQNFAASVRPADGTFRVPDTMGAVGIDHFVETINGNYAVYRKSDGVRVQGSSLNDFWAAAGAPHTGPYAFDPRVLYDPYVKRWYALSADNPLFANNFMFAVSNSSDPTAGWKGFTIDSDADNVQWLDFPMMGYNRDAVVLSGNMFPVAGGSTNTGFVVLPKSDLLLPVATVANATSFQDVSSGGTGFSVQPSVDQDNGTLPLPILSNFTSGNLKRSSFSGTALSPSLVTAGGNVTVGAYSAAPDADQPGPKANINVGDPRFGSSVVLNNGELWGIHTINVSGRAGVRWYRINESTNTLIESGTISHPSLAYFYPSIAVNDLGDVVVGFSGTDPTTFVSGYGVVGKTTGGVTTFGTPFLTKAGVSDYEHFDGVGRNRWGDYSATTVDPADPSIFWTIQEYVAATDNWGTQVTEVIIPQPNEVRWKNPVNGNYTDGSSWFGGVVPDASSHVILSRATTPGGSYTVNLSVGASATTDRLSVRQGSVTIDLQLNTFFLSNSNALTPALMVGEFGGTPTLRLLNGTVNAGNVRIAERAISTGSILLDNATLISGNLWISGDTTNAGGAAYLAVGPGSSLSIAGSTKVRTGGILESSAAVINVGSLDMTGGRVQINPGGDKLLTGQTLFMNSNSGVIELRDNAMILNYAVNSPSGTVRARITEAYSNGAWIDSGITSADADASQFAIGHAEASDLFTSFPVVFLGQEIDSTTTIARFTRYGDADLDQVVNLNDFNRLAANFGLNGFWDDGDFNYDFMVNLSDFNLLAGNFGLSASSDGPTPQDWANLAAAVPEPGTITLLALGAVGLMRRVRRKS